MYTRRFPTHPAASRPLTPPPDYSGTAIRPLSQPAQSEEAVTPPPPIPAAPLLGEVMASAVPDYARLSPQDAQPLPLSPTDEAPEPDDPRLSGGISRRPDLGGAPTPRRIRFTNRSPRRRGSLPTRPGSQPRYPLGIRPGEEGFRPGPRRAVRSVMSAISGGGESTEWQTDDILLLGLLFLLLNGGEETVKGNMDLIVILGFLLLMHA